MGLLDGFKGMLADHTPNLLPEDPDKNAAMRQALLTAGAAMMATKGQNFLGTTGQGMLAGGEAYQSALAQQQQDRLRKAQQERWDLENQQNTAALNREKEADGIIASFGDPGSISGAAGMPPASNGAPAWSGGPPPGLPRIGQPRRPSAFDSSLDGAPGAGGSMPTAFAPGQPPRTLPSLEGVPMLDGSQPAPRRATSLEGVPKIGDSEESRAGYASRAYEKNMGLAQQLMAKGHIKRAKEYFEAAKEQQPKVKDIRELTTRDGRSVVVNMFEDGRPPQEIEGYAPQGPKLTYQDLGNETVGLDSQGVVKVRFKNGERPGSKNRAGNGGEMGGVASSPFSQDAIENAAARYNLDGTLPPMGMGKSGVQVRASILNRAAVLASGVDPEDQRRQQLNNKGDIGARNSAVRSFSTGKDAQAVQSANTALNHLVTIRQLAEAQKSGDSRAWNKAARAFGTQFGVDEPTNLNAALIMVAPEISKAVIGAGGTGHERDQALKALDPNGSPDQILGATHTMEELFGGRLTEAKRTYERTTKFNDFDTSMLSPAAREVLARQPHGADPGPTPTGGQPTNKVTPLKQVPKKPPAVGTVDGVHRFKGGDPANRNNWEKIR